MSQTPLVISKTIIEALKSKGFVIQAYISRSTNSVYLKLDYGVCNTIRISDHEGKKHLHYRYNLLVGGENNIIEEKYIRYFFNEKSIAGLLYQILFDKAMKLQKYGKQNYKRYMAENKSGHENDNGFWKEAKLVTEPVMPDNMWPSVQCLKIPNIRPYLVTKSELTRI